MNYLFKVYKGRNRNTGAFVAVKTCVFNDDFAHNHEIKLLRQFDSPYIIKYIDTQVVSYCFFFSTVMSQWCWRILFSRIKALLSY